MTQGKGEKKSVFKLNREMDPHSTPQFDWMFVIIKDRIKISIFAISNFEKLAQYKLLDRKIDSV